MKRSEPGSYSLSPHCRFVKGACRSAVYDLKNGKVYSLNADATKLLELALARMSVPGRDSARYLEELRGLGLLTVGRNEPVEPPPDAAPRLRYAWLELTGRCNCACLHCYGAFGAPQAEETESELSLPEWEAVIRRIRGHGCRSVQLIGGEPLLHPHFAYILDFARRQGMDRVDVFTNGTLADDAAISAISAAGASVRVSLYGYDEASHDSITQRKGSFRALDRTLGKLREAHIPTTIAVVVMRENQGSLDRIKTYIERAGHRFAGFDTARPVKGVPLQCHAVTDTEVLRQRYMEAPKFFTSPERYGINKIWNSCWFGKCAVTSRGDILPCIFARDMLCGNIRRDDAETIRERLLSYWKITKDCVDACRDCEYRYACDDCRPLAEGTGASLYAKYPRCCYNPYAGEWTDAAALLNPPDLP